MTSDFAAPLAATGASLDAVHIHPPKVELFDVAAMVNTDPKGIRRAVDEYRVEDFGLYMARPMHGHPQLAYIESWLLPDLGLRVSRWRPRPGRKREDYYIDLVDIDRDFGSRTGTSVWRMVDAYLDILVFTRDRLEVLDTNELLAALECGLIAAGTAQRAFERTYRTVEGITRHGYDVDAWLRESGVQLVWRQR